LSNWGCRDRLACYITDEEARENTSGMLQSDILQAGDIVTLYHVTQLERVRVNEILIRLAQQLN
jgi:hypothetical protein